MRTSPVVTETARQVRALLPYERLRFVSMDDRTLRVHRKRGRVVVNTDIEYVPGRDLYHVSRHRFTGFGDDLKTTTFDDVYADMLGEIILRGDSE